VVRTQPGFPPGVDLDVDSLVLDSAPGGAALAVTPSGRAQATQSGPAPKITVVRSSATSAKVVVHDPTSPFWMVLGQSTNAGWHATTGTGVDLGTPQLIDGYANGWLVTPPQPGHDMVITLDWTPQRLVDVALVVSAGTLALCLVLACWPRRRRRARGEPVAVPAGPTGVYRTTVPTVTSTVGASPVTSTVGAGDGARPAGEPDDAAPLLGSPLRSHGARPRWFVTVVVALVVGGITSAVIAPEAGIPVGLAAFVALVLGYARIFLALGSVGLLVAVDRMVTTGQGKFRFLAEFGWPTHFESAGTLAWFAVAALGADALVQEVRDRRARAVARDGDVMPAPPTDAAGHDTGGRRPRRRRRRGKHVRSV
jgi:hypothetical protein